MEQNKILIDKLKADMTDHISKIRRLVLLSIELGLNTVMYVPNSMRVQELDILVILLRSFSKCTLNYSNIDYTNYDIVIELFSNDENKSNIIKKFIDNITIDENIHKMVNKYMNVSKHVEEVVEIYNKPDVVWGKSETISVS